LAGWRDFDEQRELLTEAQTSQIPDLKAPISGSDRDPNVLIKRVAMQNDVAFNIR